MESRRTFFRENEEVKNKLETVMNIINKDDDKYILDNFNIILDNLSYLKNCLNSYREVKNVLDPHLNLLVHSFLDFLKKSFKNVEYIICHYKKNLNEEEKKRNENDNINVEINKYNNNNNNNNDDVNINCDSLKICRERQFNSDLSKQKLIGGNNCNNNTVEDTEKGIYSMMNIDSVANKENIKNKIYSHNDDYSYITCMNLKRNLKSKYSDDEMLNIYIIIKEIYKYYNTLISVRGEKKIKSLFTCNSFYLYNIVDLLLLLKREEKIFEYISNLVYNKTGETNSWVFSYILIIWLSFCLYIPFKLIDIDKDMLNKIEEIYYYYIKKNEKSKEACSILYPNFLRRPDVYESKIYFYHFFLISKEIIMKLIYIDSEKDKSKELKDESFYIITNKELPSYCDNMKFNNIILHGILLTHKRVLKRVEKKILLNYKKFYNYFLIQNYKYLDFTETSKALKILCLGYYALLFLEKNEDYNDVTKRHDETNHNVNCNNDILNKKEEERKNENNIYKLNKKGTLFKSNICFNSLDYEHIYKDHPLFHTLPMYLNINDAFIEYKRAHENKHLDMLGTENFNIKSSLKKEKDNINTSDNTFVHFNYNNTTDIEQNKCEDDVLYPDKKNNNININSYSNNNIYYKPSYQEQLEHIKIVGAKKFICESHIIEILNIFFFYFNDKNSYIRWCLSKSFGNIMIYLNIDNINVVINNFDDYTKFNDYNILCTINYTLFHFLFNKNIISLHILNYLLKKIIYSLYSDNVKIYPSAFVLLYSLFKYNKYIKMNFHNNVTSINYFLFHLIFIKLIILSLFQDNINIRKSAMSLLQIYIGKFNFFYELKYKNIFDNNNTEVGHTYLNNNNTEVGHTYLNNNNNICDNNLVANIPLKNYVHNHEEKKNINSYFTDKAKGNLNNLLDHNIYITNSINNQEHFFDRMLDFINLFFNHSDISAYYENVRNMSNGFLDNSRINIPLIKYTIDNKNINIDDNKNINMDDNKNINMDDNKNINMDDNKNINMDDNKNIHIDDNKNIHIDDNKNIHIDHNKNIHIDDNTNCLNIFYERNHKYMNIIKRDIFNKNIELLQTCNFNELINLKKSIIIKTKMVCNFFLYKYPIIYHLYSKKLFHENVNVRLLSSESLSNLCVVDCDYFIYVVLPFLIKKSYEENVLIKHGSIICISKILLKLKKRINENLQNDIKNIIIYSEKKRIYKYKKGEILRHSLCLLIQSICQCNYFLVKKNTCTFFKDILNNNLFHYNEIIQFEASKIFYYLPIYLLNKQHTIEFIYQVFFNIIKKKNNFLHLKGYFILLCFVNDTIIPHVCHELVQLFYYILKKNSTLYKTKHKYFIKHKKENIQNVNEEYTNDYNDIKKDVHFFKKINFESYPIDYNMKIFCLLSLFNVVNNLRNIYISDFLKVYTKCTINFKGLIKTINPKIHKKKNINNINIQDMDHFSNSTNESNDMDNCYYEMENNKIDCLKKKASYLNGSGNNSSNGKELEDNLKNDRLYKNNNINNNNNNNNNNKIDDKYFCVEKDSVDINYNELTIPLNVSYHKKKRRKRNTSFYIKKDINFIKKEINWDNVLEKSKKKNGGIHSDILEYKLNINKITKILILYLQEYVYENDIGDSHIFVREICLGLTIFLLTSYPLYFFKKRNKNVHNVKNIENIENIENVINTYKDNIKDNNDDISLCKVDTCSCEQKLNYPNEKSSDKNKNMFLSKNYFYEQFESDNSYEDEDEEHVSDKKGTDDILKNEKETYSIYILYNIKKKYINILIQLLLKLLCEKNMRTHKMCLFLLNYLYNYAIFNTKEKRMDTFSFHNVFNKYCHDFSYELFLKKKIDDNIRKSKMNIYNYLNTYSDNIYNVFENIIIHTCDYYQPLYLKENKDQNIEFEKENIHNNPCCCMYEEEITSLFLNKNYKFNLIKTIFNKINNFIYLYNYALKYASSSIFHKNKYISTRKGLIKGHTEIDNMDGCDKMNNMNNMNDNLDSECKNNCGFNIITENEKNDDLCFDSIFDNIQINNDFIDEMNMSENEEQISIEEEGLIKDVHFLLDKAKKNISVVKCLEYNETYLYKHIFYLLFLNKYNYYIINGFFNSLCYYSSYSEYSNYEYTNMIKKGNEKSIEFLFLEFLQTYKNIYTFGYIRDDILFLYIRYYKKYYVNYDYSIVDNIIYQYNNNKNKKSQKILLYPYKDKYENILDNEENENIHMDENMKNVFNKCDSFSNSSNYMENYFSLFNYNMHDINLKEIISLEKKCTHFNYSYNIFNNYNIYFDGNIILFYNNVDCDNINKSLQKKKRIKENKKIKKEQHEKIELLPYVNICLIKILYFLNNFNLVQLEIFLKSVNSFIKSSTMNNFAAYTFLHFFLLSLDKYNSFALIKTISEVIINIFMCPTIHNNIKRLAMFLILQLLVHRYPKIREFTNEYFYANINFISPSEFKHYLFNSYEDLESIISILINTQFSIMLKKENCHIKLAVEEISTLLNIPY
ncbi:conserved Plasmodium protein, unknown function [Plasmodium gaboni]|uniref:PI3K/PI4K catalytic domain-containing protein n=1 Tax=Plasmodium gaboni TaxID=647221 RepID=A0ABY1UY74_9APIC|nr:conserved Plasmodium protein, unknown function [Plasmodium gaboni]